MNEEKNTGLEGKLTDVEVGDIVVISKLFPHDLSSVISNASGYVLKLTETEMTLGIEDPFAEVAFYQSSDMDTRNREEMFRRKSTYYLSSFDKYVILKKGVKNQKEKNIV